MIMILYYQGGNRAIVRDVIDFNKVDHFIEFHLKDESLTRRIDIDHIYKVEFLNG